MAPAESPADSHNDQQKEPVTTFHDSAGLFGLSRALSLSESGKKFLAFQGKATCGNEGLLTEVGDWSSSTGSDQFRQASTLLRLRPARSSAASCFRGSAERGPERGRSGDQRGRSGGDQHFKCLATSETTHASHRKFLKWMGLLVGVICNTWHIYIYIYICMYSLLCLIL